MAAPEVFLEIIRDRAIEDIVLDSSIDIDKFTELFGSYLMDRNIEVYDKKCISCGECYNVCPVNTIELNGPDPIKINDN